MFNFLSGLFLSFSFGGFLRQFTVRISPFEWRFSRSDFKDVDMRQRALNIGPLMLKFTKIFSILLIMASTASAQQPYWRGTPPRAVYTQPIQTPIYQPGVRIYYHSQHVPLPGFGTVITNQYRYVPSHRIGPSNKPTTNYKPGSRGSNGRYYSPNSGR